LTAELPQFPVPIVAGRCRSMRDVVRRLMLIAGAALLAVPAAEALASDPD
jgi:hypothetical protein